MFSYYNPHPNGKQRGDCVIRALTKAMNKSWQDVYIDLCIEGYISCDMPTANAVWGRYLLKNGFSRGVIPVDCSESYSIEDFSHENPNGIYVVGTGSHAVAIVDGIIYDTWNSSEEQPIYFYSKGDCTQ